MMDSELPMSSWRAVTVDLREMGTGEGTLVVAGDSLEALMKTSDML
jgi:hypothetical protein